MSKGLKKVLPIVAAIAIPFAAPAIVGSIAASGALGATLTGALGTTAGFTAGTALTGAALGAGTAALSGQNVGRGALFGGIAGGLGGFAQGPAQLQSAGIGTESLAGLGGPATTGYAGAAPVPLATGTAGATVPGAGVLQPQFLGADAVSRVAQAGAGGAPTTFMQALRQVPGNIAARFRDPEALADLTLRAGGMLAGSAIAGTGLSPQEQQLLQAQQEELAWLRENNQAEFNRRLSEAQQLLGEARYFDPEYFGLQAARRQQVSGAIAEREGIRGLTGAQREAEQRRFRLGTARSAGTAYDVGFGEGVRGRTQLQQAGLQALPQPSQFTTGGGYAQLARAYGDAGQRGQDQARDIGRMFGALTGAPRTREEDEEEQRRVGLIGGP